MPAFLLPPGIRCKMMRLHPNIVVGHLHHWTMRNYLHWRRWRCRCCCLGLQFCTHLHRNTPPLRCCRPPPFLYCISRPRTQYMYCCRLHCNTPPHTRYKTDYMHYCSIMFHIRPYNWLYSPRNHLCRLPMNSLHLSHCMPAPTRHELFVVHLLSNWYLLWWYYRLCRYILYHL